MLYCTILNYAPLCHLMLCSAMHSTLLCSALLSSGLLSSPLLYSTLIYSSILHHTILCICTEENLGESAQEVYSNYTNARLQKGQHLHHHSKSLLLDSHILTKTLKTSRKHPQKHPWASVQAPVAPKCMLGAAAGLQSSTQDAPSEPQGSPKTSQVSPKTLQGPPGAP